MATPEDRRKLLEAITTTIADLSAIDPSDLARTSDLSPDINFKSAVPHFEQMLEICKQLHHRDLSRLTHQQLTEIDKACNRLWQLIAKVKEFTLNQNTPGDVCQSIIQEVSNAYDDVMNPLLLPMAFTATQATDYARIEREAKGYHTTMKSEAEALEKFIESARSDAERALAAVKEQAAEAGVSTNAQIFLGDAREHNKAARSWLTATVWTASATLLAAAATVVIAFVYRPPDLEATIQYVIAKLLMLSVLSFSVVWCARNFRSHRHNETLNRRRANALMTFRAFVEGTADDRVKDAILLQASQAAFRGRPTGFDAPESEGSTVNPVVEVLGRMSARQE